MAVSSRNSTFVIYISVETPCSMSLYQFLSLSSIEFLQCFCNFSSIASSRAAVIISTFFSPMPFTWSNTSRIYGAVSPLAASLPSVYPDLYTDSAHNVIWQWSILQMRMNMLYAYIYNIAHSNSSVSFPIFFLSNFSFSNFIAAFS